MFLSGLDDIDRRLVELLIHNARMSYSDLGQAVGLSRVAVKARVRALEERGVIEEYTTIVNPQKISGAVSCYFELEVEPAQFSAVVDTLRASDTVTQIYQVLYYGFEFISSGKGGFHAKRNSAARRGGGWRRGRLCPAPLGAGHGL